MLFSILAVPTYIPTNSVVDKQVFILTKFPSNKVHCASP